MNAKDSDMSGVMSAVMSGGRKLLTRASGPRLASLEEQVAGLQLAIEDSRRLNERLSDVLDVVVELLVPAVDRDDERLKAALEHLGKTV